MCTINNDSALLGQPFGENGCQVPVGQGICGETKTLQIINEFRQLYEAKLHEIDCQAGGDCLRLQEKVKLQQEWIGDLTEQNEMLVKAVEELENEATDRVQMLEDKLEQSAKCICEVMKKYREHDVTSDLLREPLQKLFYLENDHKNLLEFIRRVREKRDWSIDGLKFYDVTKQDLFGDSNSSAAPSACNCDETAKYLKMEAEQDKQGEQQLHEKERLICKLQEKIEYYDSFGDVQSIAQELQSKKEECDCLKQSMMDMRHALTEEVAAKHDTILLLKRDCIQLEDRCQTADKQVAFKDDIIKELRKEIKQLKQQKSSPEKLPKSPPLSPESKPMKRTEDKVCLTVVKHNTNVVKTGRNKDIEKLLNDLNTENRKMVDIIAVLKYDNFQTENENLKEKTKLLESDKENLTLLHEEEKFQLDDLETQFQEFLKDKETLKSKCKSFEKCIKEASEEIKELKNENNLLKINAEKLCMADCCYKLDGILQEHQKAISQIVNLNNENQELNKTISHLRKRVNDSSSVTKEEIEKLNATIDDLQNDLQRSKILQDQEVAIYQKEICELNSTLADLENQAKDYQEFQEKQVKICKICKGRCKVGFTDTPDISIESEQQLSQLEKQLITISNKEEIIKIQNDTLNIMKLELQALKEKDLEIEQEKRKHNCKTQHLLDKIADLENALDDCQGRANNLQAAVDMYLNSINVLEASEEKAKIEIEQQKSTILNLQSALVIAKQDLDDLKHKSEDNLHNQCGIINILYVILVNAEEQKQNISNQLKKLSQEYSYFQDLNFELEVEHCAKLQDIGILETQLSKYKSFLETCQDENSVLKLEVQKLSMQKKCFEQVVMYFKEEMKILAEQLCNLQELLNHSNETAQAESSRLVHSFEELQEINEKLSSQLCEAGCSIQDSEAKICHLQQLINEKDVDLLRHDQAICKIKQTLECSLHQNNELQSTVTTLNETITTLQVSIRNYEQENFKTKENANDCNYQINNCMQKLTELKCNLDTKTEELVKLEVAYCNQCHTLECTRQKLQEIEEIHNTQQNNLEYIIEELKQKLNIEESKIQEMSKENTHLQTQLILVSRKEVVKDKELSHYRQIVSELKITLIDLNKCLTNKEIRCGCSKAECGKNIDSSYSCEINYYQNILESLRKSVIGLKKQLQELQLQYQNLQDECNNKEQLIKDLNTSKEEQEQEYNKLRIQITEKLKKFQMEETRYKETISNLECELSLCDKNFTEKLNQCQLEEQRHRELVSKYECECNNYKAKRDKECHELEKNYNEKIHALQTEETRLKEIISKLECELRGKQSQEGNELRCCQMEVERYKDLISKLECELSQSKNQQNQECNSLSEKLRSCQMEVSRYHEMVSKLKCELSMCKDQQNQECSSLSEELQSCKMELSRYKEMVSKLECELSVIIKGKQSQESNVLQQLQISEKELNRYKEMVSKLECELSMCKNLQKQECSSLTEKFRCCQMEVLRYQELVSQLECELSVIKGKQNQECNVLQQLHISEKEVTRYKEIAAQFERELIHIRQELQTTTIELNNTKLNVCKINSSKCFELVCAQDEVKAVKAEVNTLLKKQCVLIKENQELHIQVAKMQSNICSLEEQNNRFKGQIEQYLCELQSLQTEKELLICRNKELLNELRCRQSSYGSVDQQRYSIDSVKDLESELNDLRNNRDEICFESKNVVSYVKAWLQEQKKINEHVARKEKDYCETIKKLKQDNEELACQYQCKSQKSLRQCCSKVYSPPPPTCLSPWSLGSQGTASVRDMDSFSESPRDWYSPTFRIEDTDDDDDNDWVSKVQNLANQVKRTNKMWRSSMNNSEFMVSKDKK